ncbi:MAG: HAD-IA family hydrolase [Proteobacteria bacterium]|nr:HAD-IA family hydrolase [Pseudomonadota bacterium]
MSTSNNNEIKAILWDFGGVFTSSPFEAFNVLEEQLGIPTDFIRGVNAINPTDNAWAKFESNDVSLDEFDLLFAAESEQMGHRVSGKKVVAVLSGNLRPRMVSTLQHCKEHFQVACITNNVKAGHGPSMTRDPDKADAVAEVMRLFDQVIESSKEGIRKPNPQIYLTACERLGVQPHNAVFLDDLGINLKPARELGMQTIKVLSEAQAIDDLAKLTGLTFD